jgi:F-type H+-transporting ATPase subunit a
MSEDLLFSLIIITGLVSVSFFACRRKALVPGRMQNVAEIVFGGIDDFICGILGPKGRNYTPFIGTLFLYILCMNLAGLVPGMKSPTANWSVTLALALCVFIYVQYSGIRELGFLGYVDHLFGRPRGIVAFSVFIPVLMFFIHIVSELIRPISLSLRLRSNIWGEDMLIGVLSGFGLKAVPLIVFSMGIIIIGAVVQALVFSLLTTIYFALVLTHEE